MDQVSRYSYQVHCLSAQQNTDVLSKAQRADLFLFTVSDDANQHGEKSAHMSLEVFFFIAGHCGQTEHPTVLSSCPFFPLISEKKLENIQIVLYGLLMLFLSRRMRALKVGHG